MLLSLVQEGIFAIFFLFDRVGVWACVWEGWSKEGARGGRLQRTDIRLARGLELLVAGVCGGHDGGHAPRLVVAKVLHQCRAVCILMCVNEKTNRTCEGNVLTTNGWRRGQ